MQQLGLYEVLSGFLLQSSRAFTVLSVYCSTKPDTYRAVCRICKSNPNSACATSILSGVWITPRSGHQWKVEIKACCRATSSRHLHWLVRLH